MVMVAVLQQHSHKVIDMREVLAVCDAFWLNHKQTLEGVNNFLQHLPMLRGLPDPLKIAINDFINLLVFFYED